MDEIEVYKSVDGAFHVEVRFEEDSVWLNQQQMSMLFSQTKQNVSCTLITASGREN